MTETPYILAIDVGTTAVKAVLFAADGHPHASSTQEYELETPAPQIVEVDAEVYWQAVKNAIGEILATSRVAPEDIVSVGVTSQGETLIALDASGQPLRKAIVWLDNRATVEAEEIAGRFSLDDVYRITGQNEIAPGWPASKILWLKKNEPDVFASTAAFLMVEDYVIYRMTGALTTDHALNPSSLYYDIENLCWWDEMLTFLGIRSDQLPKLLYSGQVAGHVTADIGLESSTTVTVAPIDQIAGAVGAGNIAPGMITETTGSALAICATLDRPAYDPEKQVGLYLHAQRGAYVLLPWNPTAGMIFRWFRDALGGGKSYEELAAGVDSISPGADNLTVLPDFSKGGAFIGLTLAHSQAHMVRAIFESVAFMLRENIELLEKAGAEIGTICSLGGASHSATWTQIKADVLQRSISLMECEETTCLGVAMLSAVGAGLHQDLETAKHKMVRTKHVVEPNTANAAPYDAAFGTYKARELKND